MTSTIMPTLRQYQKDVISEVRAHWLNGKQNVLAVAATGSGKTVIFSSIIAEEPAPVCAVAHRHELVSQMSMALARCGVRHRIIGSSALARECRANHLDEFGVNYVDPNSRVAVASVDTLIGMDASDPWFASVKLWVMDECFIAGTMIGDTPIERIKVGDTVDAFNDVTGKIEQRQVVRLFRNPAPKHMVRVSAGHHVLHCTYGHPFYTRRGWVEAGRLTSDDEILEHELHTLRRPGDESEASPNLRIENEGQDILSKGLRLGVPDGQPKAEGRESKANRTMSDVWGCCGPIGASTITVGKDRPSLLQQAVFGAIQGGSVFRDDGSDEPRTRVGTDAQQQPYVEPGHEGKDGRYVSQPEPPAEGARREWSAANTSGKCSAGDVRRLGVRPAVLDTHIQAEGFRLPAVLQAGYGQPVDAPGTGSGRGESRGQAAFGCKERCALNWVRVDSVEIYERANYDGPELSSDDGYVYNFEVEGLHTYIANGIVVHNCHHVLKHNKWGTAVNMFPNARGLGVTAETERADGYGLGRMNDGVFDAMVVAPTMRDLINMGFLTEYRVIVPPSNLDLTKVDVSKATGDYSSKKLAKATKASTVMGDIVTHYQRYASGKLGITFAVDIEAATDIAEAFRKAGVPAEVVSSKTDAVRRRDILRQFKRREILQLVNVDLFGEGFDLPAIECVSMGRGTKSFNLYKQQFGRALRLLAGKDRAIIIDHVGNVMEHGLPDKRKTFSLGRPTPKPQREPDEDLIPQRVCLGCSQPYDRDKTACPYCKVRPIPVSRGGPEYVDGDLHELSPEKLAEMRGDAEAVYAPAVIPWNVEPYVVASIKKKHHERAQAIGMLKETMSLWAGWRAHLGQTPAELQKLFYLTYGIDVLSAQSLNASDAYELRDRVQARLNRNGIIAIQ